MFFQLALETILLPIQITTQVTLKTVVIYYYHCKECLLNIMATTLLFCALFPQ